MRRFWSGLVGLKHQLAMAETACTAACAACCPCFRILSYSCSHSSPCLLRRHRIELATQREEERRAALTSRLCAKQERVAAMEAERAAMLKGLEVVRREIQAQEAHLK